MKQIIENISKRVIDKFFDFDNNDYNFEGAVVEPENGIYEAERLSISFYIEIGTHTIDCALSMTGKKVDYIEAIFEEGFENIQEAVNNYLEENLDTSELWSLAFDDVRENSMDEYQRNGFASAADYWHYRFSA